VIDASAINKRKDHHVNDGALPFPAPAGELGPSVTYLPVDGPWTPACYRGLLTGLLARGYRPGTVREFEASGSAPWHAALFHDVEVDLQSSIAAARIEWEVGVSATYYICNTSPFFLGHEETIPTVVQELVRLGHDVGVHLELPEIPADTDGILARVDATAAALGCNTSMFSVHSPRRHPISSLAALPRVGPMYRRVMDGTSLFLSDSACRWNYGVPLTDPRLSSGQPLQLLTHPFWWDGRSDIAGKTAEALARGVPAVRLNEFLPRFFSTAASAV
jgi:hypothetical protein